MPDIVISEFMDEPAVKALAADFDTHYDPDLVDKPAELARLVADARALVVRNRTQVRGALLEAAPKLKAVGRLGVGLDNIDVPACQARGVQVMPATGANDQSVAEYVIAGALMLLRGAYFATAEVAAGAWPRNRLMGREGEGTTLGIVGFGGIGRRVAACAKPFGMRLIGHDPFLRDDNPAWAENGVAPAGLDQVLAQSDVVTLHVPLTDGTRNLIDPARIETMKPGAIVINAARGGIVDEAALAAALKRGRLGGAMLDVFAREPLTAENPFAGVPNLILTPHIAGVTVQSNERVSAVTAANVRRVLEGVK
ncbi:MAG TPA: hydroxyacid dehydrogenase [Alphaproteobacteria bacterium]|nr:hydroxyacid dehydrogenase [Alphaproteobacteria bacterium]